MIVFLFIYSVAVMFTLTVLKLIWSKLIQFQNKLSIHRHACKQLLLRIISILLKQYSSYFLFAVL